MKLKCIKNSSKGLLFSTTFDLVVGKTYESSPVVTFILDCPDITNVSFLVFDEKGKWELYPKELFIPLVVY